ncbi:hypothetical protein G7Y79_00057g091000 [Physcia stellaris]|nr:hypothetical protein G7Y79_00057g091000 [Physcia stellaris]
MRILDDLLLSLAELVAFASALDPNITASTPLPSVTASVFAGLPACATSCIKNTLATLTACALSDIACICTNNEFICSNHDCEQGACTQQELDERHNKTQQLCANFGGVQGDNCAASNASSNASVTASSTPSVVPFTGGGGRVYEGFGIIVSASLLSGAAVILFLL